MILDVLMAALAAAFVVSVIEYWYTLKFLKGLVAIIVAGLYFYVTGPFGWPQVFYAAGGAFTALAVLMWLERPVTIRKW